MEALASPLRQGAAELGLALDERQIQQLLGYAALLAKWNKVYNLTARAGPDDLLRLHLLDSLSVWPYLQGEDIADIGTGGGTPGLPLAIACPGRRFVLLDSNAKKTRFVRQALLELGVDNGTVATSRVEDFEFAGGFDTIVSRAFASTQDFVGQTRHLLKPGGVWLTMKGPQAEAGLQELPYPWRLQPLQVPGLEAAERYVVCIRR